MATPECAASKRIERRFTRRSPEHLALFQGVAMDPLQYAFGSGSDGSDSDSGSEEIPHKSTTQAPYAKVKKNRKRPRDAAQAETSKRDECTSDEGENDPTPLAKGPSMPRKSKVK